MDSELKIKEILTFLRTELEKAFDFEESSMWKSGPDMPGNYALNFKFTAKNGMEVEISYWDAGTLEFFATWGEQVEDVFIHLTFTPEHIYEEDSKTFITYPKESEELFLKKVNELFEILHDKNSNIKSKLPDELS